ncbi:MAG: DUF922 domain-containing protein [Nitratireductor sp.]|nr:DUF922 domain-containing protein [Nitratireductor sp.]
MKLRASGLLGVRRDGARLFTIGSMALALAACNSVSPRTNVSVGYYNVTGSSFSELDRQIALHGPHVPGVGKAIAATSVRMVPDIQFGQIGEVCRVVKARVRVQANVTLPKLSSQQKLTGEMRGAFNNIETYAKLHEAVHVKIADTYAEEAEKRIRETRPQADCNTLRSKIVATFNALMAEHEAAQQKFDEDEKKRFEKLAKEGSQVRKKKA